MAQPGSVPRWNTNATNRVDPTSGQKDTGWTVGQAPPSSFFNWWMNLVYQWVLYVQSLTSEALTWLALQTFNVGIVASTTTVNGNAVSATGNGTGAGVRGIPGTSLGAGVSAVATTISGGTALYAEQNHASGGTAIKAVIVNGFGVQATSTGSGVPGKFNSSHNVPNDNPTLSATNDSIGDVAVFTAVGGKALQVFGGENYEAAYFRGNGAISGVPGIRVVSQAPNAPAGVFVGSTGIASPGQGATFQGGSPAIGTGVPGLSATGGSGAAGARVQGGTGTGIGLDATGGSLGGAGVLAKNGLNTVDAAIDCRGSVDFTNATAPAVTANSLNKANKKNIAKAWVRVRFNNTAAPVLIDGCNIASVTYNTGNARTSINFAGSLGPDYGFIAQSEGLPGRCAVELSTVRNTNTIVLDHYRPDTVSIGAFIVDTSALMNNTTWLFMFWGQ